MKAASIQFEHVSKIYGEVAAVHDISFAIAPGTLVTLLGPSGCGKTTTLRMIAGLELPSRGTIRIGGADVTRIPASERDVSMVFQSYALFPHMSVIENVGYGLSVAGLPKATVRDKAQVALTTVGLTGFDERLPSELSGGQQQRVAVAPPCRPGETEPGTANGAGMTAKVRKAAYIGGLMEYTVATELGDLFVISMAVDRPLAAGAPVSVTLAHHGVVPIAAA